MEEEKKTQGSIVFSWGKYGGFYTYNGFSKRICLGCIAITYIPREIDKVLKNNLTND